MVTLRVAGCNCVARDTEAFPATCAEVLLLEASGGSVKAPQFPRNFPQFPCSFPSRNFWQLGLTLPDCNLPHLKRRCQK